MMMNRAVHGRTAGWTERFCHQSLLNFSFVGQPEVAGLIKTRGGGGAGGGRGRPVELKR